MNQKIWLRGIVILVLLMISLGGFTRLTRSGLSMVEWKPLTGFIPPLTEADWNLEFDKYQKSPEFQQINSNFKLADYQQIYVLEYLHRVLGRLIFLFVLLPGLWLWRRKLVSWKLVLGLCVLVASQGLVGWIMVKSGLSREPHVSHYLLTLHFFSALTVLMTAYYHLVKGREAIALPGENQRNHVQRLLSLLGFILFIQLIYGCFTAGLKAGFAFNTYPLMGGEFFPPGGLLQDPWWMNWLQNPSTIQWMHRWTGILFILGVSLLLWRTLSQAALHKLRGPVLHLLFVTFCQVLLGILNIIYVVPIWLAALHQLMAVLLLMSVSQIWWRTQRAKS